MSWLAIGRMWRRRSRAPRPDAARRAPSAPREGAVATDEPTPKGRSSQGGQREAREGSRDNDYEDFVEDELATDERETGRRGNLDAFLRSWRLFPRAARYVRPYRRQASASIGITVILALVALAEPWPLAFVIDSVLGDKAAPKWVTGLFGAGTGKLILFAVLASLLITLLGGGFTIVNEFIQTKLAGRMGLDFRGDLFQHAQRLSFTYHDDHRTGLLMYRMSGGDGAIEMLVELPSFAQNVLTMIGMAWIAYQLDPVLAQLALVVVPLMYFSTTYYARRIEPVVLQVRAMEGMSLAIAHEALAMVRVITSFGRERHEFDRFRRQGEQAVDARVRLTVRQTMFNLVVSLITATGTATVLGIGAYQVLRGHISAGELLVIMSYIAQVYTPLESLTGFLVRSQQVFIIFEYALNMLDTQPDVVEKPDAVQIDRARGEIALEGVEFGYESRPEVLKDISFQVEPGESVAIVGPTGAGKSTLMGLLPRFYDPAGGRVLLDGTDVRDLGLESLRAQFSVVLQEPLLFTGSIEDNIRYGKLDATEEEIVAAAKAANAHHFIKRLPRGYKTPLGERGAKVSGGERQRIAVARAFLRDAPILILDEPTSSIDSRTEGVILEALERLMVGRTTIMIAHRLSTVRSVDRILVLDEGAIVQQGTHDELVAQEGLYRQLWEAQASQRKPGRKRKGAGELMLEWRPVPEEDAAEAHNGGQRRPEEAEAPPEGQRREGDERERPEQQEAQRSAQQEAAREARREAAREARREARRKAARQARREARQKAREEAERQAALEAREEAERRAALEAREEAERQAALEAREEAERTAMRTRPKMISWAPDAPPEQAADAAPTSQPGAAPAEEDALAHASAASRNVDHILVLSDGGVVQHGSHDELVAREGPYREFWEASLRQASDSRPPDRHQGQAATDGGIPPHEVPVEPVAAGGRPSAPASRRPDCDPVGPRLRTIRRKDHLLVLSDGVVQQGTHDELITERGPYRRWRRPHADERHQPRSAQMRVPASRPVAGAPPDPPPDPAAPDPRDEWSLEPNGTGAAAEPSWRLVPGDPVDILVWAGHDEPADLANGGGADAPPANGSERG